MTWMSDIRQSISKKLIELKELRESGLISTDVMNEYQKKILDEYLEERYGRDFKETLTFPPALRQQVFISYSYKDENWLEKLKDMLKPVEGNFILWEDTKIRPGSEWHEEIEKAMDAAKVAILLVSPDFLASDFIIKHELPLLLEAAKKDGLKILWVAVSDSLWEMTEIKDYQALNDPSHPLESLTPAELNKDLVRIIDKIKSAVSAE